MPEAEVSSSGHAVAAIAVTRANGQIDHYYSLPWITPWNLIARKEVQRTMSEHLRADGKHFVEIPDHPIPFRRSRRRIK